MNAPSSFIQISPRRSEFRPGAVHVDVWVDEVAMGYIFLWVLWFSVSRYSDSLGGGRTGDRIPAGVRFFHTCPDRPWGPPSPLYDGYHVSFPDVKRLVRGFEYPSPSRVNVKERVQLYLYSIYGASLPVLWWILPSTFYLYFESPTIRPFEQCPTHMIYCITECHGGVLSACCPQTTEVWTVQTPPTRQLNMIPMSLQAMDNSVKLCVHFTENKSGLARRWELISWRRAHWRPRASLTRPDFSVSGAGCQHAEVQVHCHTREGGSKQQLAQVDPSSLA